MPLRTYRVIKQAFWFRTLPETQALRLGTPTVERLGERIRMVCWNVFKVVRGGALADIAALSAETDLMLLQEAVLHGAQPHVLHLTSGLEWIMAETLGHARRGITTGPKTGCRAPCTAIASLRSLDQEPILGTPKASLLTRYPTARGPLTVINVHAVNFVPLAKFARQVAQVVELAAGDKGSLVVGGDFNTWNPARHRVLMDAMHAAGLERVPVTVPRRWRHFGQQLDHVFIRGLKVVAARPLAHIVSSDHIPLRVEFAVV